MLHIITFFQKAAGAGILFLTGQQTCPLQQQLKFRIAYFYQQI